MKDFIKSSEGRRLFNIDLPNMVKQLTKIADELAKYNEFQNIELIAEISPVTGRFEEITKDEQVELAEMKDKFDGWFDIMVTNFKLSEHFDEESVESIKNIARHAWNAGKDVP